MIIPETDNALVIRTDFSKDEDWESVCNEIIEPVGEFQAYVDFLDNPEFNNLTIEKLLSLIPEESDHTFIFVVDNTTFTHSEHPILCIDLFDNPGKSFRVIPSEMCGVENNLSLANMDFDEFYDSTGSDFIFRGFSD